MDPTTQVEIFKVLLTIITLFALVMILVILWKKRDEIRAFFWPGSWAEIEMLELDNNCNVWLQQKSKSLQFKFNEGVYNMFHPGTKEVARIEKKEDGTVEEVRETIPVKQPAIYRSGRLAKFFYIEGNEDPLDYRNNTITGNPQINEQMNKVEVSRMITSAGGLGQELMAKYGFFILVGIGVFLVIILIYMVQQGQSKQVVETGAQLAGRGG